MKSICVFSSSSNALDTVYFTAARELGREIGRRGIGMIFGGGLVGLMGAVAHAVHEEGGHVTGVIPTKLNRPGIAYPDCDELIVTETMRERKAAMDGLADAFIALPGGFGTLEELMEVITLKQLGYHHRPVVLLTTNGFYDPLMSVFQRMFEDKFAKEHYRDLYYLAADVAAVFQYLDNYQPGENAGKWF